MGRQVSREVGQPISTMQTYTEAQGETRLTPELRAAEWQSWGLDPQWILIEDEALLSVTALTCLSPIAHFYTLRKSL